MCEKKKFGPCFWGGQKPQKPQKPQICIYPPVRSRSTPPEQLVISTPPTPTNPHKPPQNPRKSSTTVYGVHVQILATTRENSQHSYNFFSIIQKVLHVIKIFQSSHKNFLMMQFVFIKQILSLIMQNFFIIYKNKKKFL